MSYFVTGAEAVHRADLVRAEGLTEQVDRRHLAPEDPLLINVGSWTHVAFVERLENKSELLTSGKSALSLNEWMQRNMIESFIFVIKNIIWVINE